MERHTSTVYRIVKQQQQQHQHKQYVNIKILSMCANYVLMLYHSGRELRHPTISYGVSRNMKSTHRTNLLDETFSHCYWIFFFFYDLLAAVAPVVGFFRFVVIQNWSAHETRTNRRNCKWSTQRTKCIINFIESTLNMHLWGSSIGHDMNANKNDDGHTKYRQIFQSKFTLITVPMFFPAIAHEKLYRHYIGNVTCAIPMLARLLARRRRRRRSFEPLPFGRMWHSFVVVKSIRISLY